MMLLLACYCSNVYSQRLNNVLEGFSISKVATSQPVVGAKYVTDIGTTTEGFTSENLIEARSIDFFSLNAENKAGLTLGLKSIFSIGIASMSDLDIEIKDLQIVKIRDLYNIPLVKNEMIVFEAIKAGSFVLTYNKDIDAKIKAELPVNAEVVELQASNVNQKKLKISSTNLFIAYKIIKIDKVSVKKSTKKINQGFKIKDINDYDISFDITDLIAKVDAKVITEVGMDNFVKLKAMNLYVTKYSSLADIQISLASAERGVFSGGIFQKTVPFCYCNSVNDISSRTFLIYVSNTGKNVTYEYLVIDFIDIDYSKNSYFQNEIQKPVTIRVQSPGRNSKVTIVSKTYTISNIIKT